MRPMSNIKASMMMEALEAAAPEWKFKPILLWHGGVMQ